MRYGTGFMRLTCVGVLAMASTLSLATVLDAFNQRKNDPNALYAFLKEMPKGGELHYHIAGGAYPETMVAVAAASDNFCLDVKNFSIAKNSACKGIEDAKLLADPRLYNQIIEAWSLKNFIPTSGNSAHDHFFNSFYKFIDIVINHQAAMVAEIMKRASSQHENYLELMGIFNPPMLPLPSLEPLPDRYDQLKQELLANPEFTRLMQQTIEQADNLLPAAKKLLDCDKHDVQEVCKLSVKFQYHVLREQSLKQFFADALLGFAAANQSQALVAVNLVQVEDSLVALRDYKDQMAIFNYMHTLYPKVHIALHAGELSLGIVPPEQLRFHIMDAIQKGHAERIGHGVDIAYEGHGDNVADLMAKQSIAVEICLSSNRALLNVFGRQHPLNYYLKQGVPVVLSTDDEGILRIDLTHEYVQAVLNHGLDYPQIKQINRNALSYSFLPGASIWEDVGLAKRVKFCQDLNSAECLEFVSKSEKATVQRSLELKLNAFEARY